MRLFLHGEGCCGRKTGSDFAGCQETQVSRKVAEQENGCYFRGVKTAVLRAEQFVTDAEGKRVGVLLDLRAYERLRKAQEELVGIQAHDTALPTVRSDIASGEFASLAAYQAKRARKRK
jgi:hypothetical protein